MSRPQRNHKMKRLVSPSTVLIIGTKPFIKSLLVHDKWHVHSFGDLSAEIDFAASGKAVVYLFGELVSGDGFYWPFYLGSSLDAAIIIEDNLYVTPYQNFNSVTTGLWFNYVYRASVFDKVPFALWGAWLASH